MLVFYLALALAALALAGMLWRLRDAAGELAALTAGVRQALDELTREIGRTAGAVTAAVNGLSTLEREAGEAAAIVSRTAKRLEFLERVAERRVAGLLFALSGAVAAVQEALGGLGRPAGGATAEAAEDEGSAGGEG